MIFTTVIIVNLIPPLLIPSGKHKTMCSHLSKDNESFCVLIHGGAGVISPDNIDAPKYKTALQNILRQIYHYVQDHESKELCVADVVEFGVKLLEDEALFNAGKGAVYTHEGKHELEASIMEGQRLRCGAVSMVTNIKNPVSAAMQVMKNTPHNYLVGESVEKLADKAGLERVNNDFFDTPHRKEQLDRIINSNTTALDHNISTTCNETQEKSSTDKTGTVGCVCMLHGHVAAATSTGGMTNKMSGRIGDSPIIGAGTYADDRTCAVSCTGVGEEFMRYVAAYDISARMQYQQDSLHEAVRGTVFKRLPRDTGGVIAVDHLGNYAIEFNTPGMFRGMINSRGQACVGIWIDNEPFQV